MDGWNTIVSFWVPAYFQGRAVSFREGKPLKNGPQDHGPKGRQLWLHSMGQNSTVLDTPRAVVVPGRPGLGGLSVVDFRVFWPGLYGANFGIFAVIFCCCFWGVKWKIGIIFISVGKQNSLGYSSFLMKWL